MLRWCTPFLIALWPHLASAQDWATRQACFSPPTPVTAADVAPFDLSALEAEAQSIINPNGRFWRIESENGQVSHLWGTMHVSHSAVLNLPEATKQAIETARIVALEIDYTFQTRDEIFAALDMPHRYRTSTSAFNMPQPLDLSFLDADAQEWVFERLETTGIGADVLYALSYGGLAEILLSDPCDDFTSGVIPHQDHFIQTLAHIAGARIIGLEEQGEFLADLANDPETAKAMLAVYASYLQPPPEKEWTNGFIQFYLEGRIGILDAWDAAHVQSVLGAKGLEWKKATDDYLISARNKRFLTRIIPELETGGVFMAVGAAHLPGPEGLVELLRNQGFTVTRHKLPGEVE